MACEGLSVLRPPGRVVVSGAGGHVGGEDVVGVAVEVLAGPVLAHGGARVGVAGGDLDIAQVDARSCIHRMYNSRCGRRARRGSRPRSAHQAR